MIDKILKKFGISFEELSEEEVTTLNTWLEQLKTRAITPDDIRNHVLAMKDSVEQELINTPEYIDFFFVKLHNRKQILLKARLRNYMLLDAFFTSPERAKKALEAQIETLAAQKERNNGKESNYQKGKAAKNI